METPEQVSSTTLSHSAPDGISPSTTSMPSLPTPPVENGNQSEKPRRPEATPLMSFISATTADSPFAQDLTTIKGPQVGYFEEGVPPNAIQDPDADDSNELLRMVLSSWPMYGFLLIGIIAALSHHFFYAKYHGKPAQNQSQLQKYGGLLAVIAKTCFCAAIIYAYRQQVWSTVRHKHLQIRTLDSLFAGSDDISAIFNMEMLTNAKVALALLCLIW
jgi:hypothetical protein